MDLNLIYKKIINAINEARKILLVAHLDPDVDAIGSGCVLAEHLFRLGKNCQVYCQDELDLNLRFLPGSSQFQNQLPDINDFDLVLALDCADSGRSGLAEQIRKRKENIRIINIDHHVCNDFFGDINLVRLDCSSTAEIIYDLLKEARLHVSKKMAFCLLAGIIYDTTNFTNPATNHNSLGAAASLMLLGANLTRAIQHVYQNKSLATLKLWGSVLTNLHYNPEYDLAVSIVTQKNIKEYGLVEELVEGIANFLNNIINVKILLVLRELNNGRLKGSLRTNYEDADVKRIAEAFGGGGHVKAAGFVIPGQLQRIDERWVVV
jgi:phosphoesterase RecJ-like protein